MNKVINYETKTNVAYCIFYDSLINFVEPTTEYTTKRGQIIESDDLKIVIYKCGSNNRITVIGYDEDEIDNVIDFIKNQVITTRPKDQKADMSNNQETSTMVDSE
jgi:hypothetical protein